MDTDKAMDNSDDHLFCRLCMKKKDVILKYIFEEDDSNEADQIPLTLKIMSCLEIEVDLDDNISRYVCHCCNHYVNLFYKFKKRTKEIDMILREKIRKQMLNVHFQEEPSCDNDSDELQTVDEPTLLLLPHSNASKQENLKDPLALSDDENNDILERKPVHLVQEKSSVKIDDVIKEQRESFNKIRKTRKKQFKFLDLENTIKQQREIFKSKDLKNSLSPEKPIESTKDPAEVTEEPVINKTYCRHCHKSIPSEQFTKHFLNHQKKKLLPIPLQKKLQFQKFKRITRGGKKMYCCIVCSKLFIMKYSLQRHMLLHQAKDILKKKKIHQCPVCDKKYTVGSSLKRHLILHTGERPFKCPICPRTFSDRSNLIKHERIHYPAKPFNCTICPAQFQFKSYLKKHLAQHLNNKRDNFTSDHDCYTKKLRPDEQIAMLMPTNKAWLGKHLLSFSVDTSSDENVSDSEEDTEVPGTNSDEAEAGPSTSQQQEITQLEEDQHTEMEKDTQSSGTRCRSCQTICPTYEQLVEHRKIHSGVSGFRCMVCKSLFQSQSALTRHVASSHFKCSTCDKAFMTKLICQNHEKEHKSSNRNACGICDRIFLSIDALSRHMMKHNLQAPFKCALCNSEFTSRTVLEMHFKVCCRQRKQQQAAESAK